jgi:isopentenyl diphosphate isomerase/L-lactate dehydrogenase-like FMN-dependent dehydrogenase
MTWKDVGWLRSIARVPVLLKGILNPDDAERSVERVVEILRGELEMAMQLMGRRSLAEIDSSALLASK